MRAPKFKHFAPKVDALQEVPLRYESNPFTLELGRLIDGPENEGKPVNRVLNPLPCLVIFVHGVNSEGEWYNAAEQHICAGLNDRLERWGTPVELISSVPEDGDPMYTYDIKHPLKRTRPHFEGGQNAANSNYLFAKSPVIRFYWGFKARKGDYGRPSEHDYRDVHHPELRDYPVALDQEDAWGGGPFQNGTSGLWHMFRKDKGFTLDFQRFNPITDRYLTECPPRTYYVHAARRLAHLIATVRRNSPHETINIVSHSQGTMVSTLATLMLKEQGVRGPEALFVCKQPFQPERTRRPDGVRAVRQRLCGHPGGSLRHPQGRGRCGQGGRRARARHHRSQPAGAVSLHPRARVGAGPRRVRQVLRLR
ncbi:hypothetical protein V4891_21815 [Ralstonia solanacearum species complex bacterium KE055]